nr:MAG TPA: hypothetical protein [Caudoviricetes sp.]
MEFKKCGLVWKKQLISRQSSYRNRAITYSR